MRLTNLSKYNYESTQAVSTLLCPGADLGHQTLNLINPFSIFFGASKTKLHFFVSQLTTNLSCW